MSNFKEQLEDLAEVLVCKPGESSDGMWKSQATIPLSRDRVYNLRNVNQNRSDFAPPPTRTFGHLWRHFLVVMTRDWH